MIEPLIVMLVVIAVSAFIVSGFWVVVWFAILDLMESVRKWRP